MADRTEAQTQANPSVEAGHEISDVSVPSILRYGLGLVVLMVVTYLAMTFTFRYFDEVQAQKKKSRYPLAERTIPSQPRLEVLDRDPLPAEFGKIQDPVRVSRAEDLNRLRWVSNVRHVGHLHLMLQASTLPTSALGGASLTVVGQLAIAARLTESDRFAIDPVAQIPIKQARDRFIALMRNEPNRVRDPKEAKKYSSQWQRNKISDANSGRGRRKDK